MRHWLTARDAPIEQDVVKRFDPLHWTVDFPRGAMASVVTSLDGHGLTVEASFLRANDLIGLIWSSEDGDAHPAHARETSRDYAGCVLRFRWRSTGLAALDAVNGPTLTIEGRNAAGALRGWYVRLWNYATGSGVDARISLDFDALDGGFLLPGEADRVDPARIDRMFISMVPPGYNGASSALLATPAAATLRIDDISCDGAGSVLALNDAMVPAHGLRIATGYDDQYDLPPERIVQAIHRLGFRGVINHYIGMSHYFALGSDGLLNPVVPFNAAARAWHQNFARAAKAWGYDVIWSLSYEILDMFCPQGWKQRSYEGAPALTGYVPPSTLVSPASGPGIAFLSSVAAALGELATAAGLDPKVQIGEPWWWVTADHRPCFYDASARALLGGAPIEIGDVRGPKIPQEIALLEAAGTLLASSTQAVAAASGSQTYLLVYLPGLLDPAAPEMRRANLPTGWASPAFDVLQTEDYEWVTSGRRHLTAAARTAVTARLGYPIGEQQYFSGFAADAGDWSAIVDAARDAQRAGVGEVFIWALPQVLRDGLTLFGKDDDVTPFEDLNFPIAIGAEASASPGFSTNVVTSASGHETRNVNWQQARLRFDAGPGVRGDEELGTLIAFFRARRGAAVGFRFRDAFDHSSSNMTGVPVATDQSIGGGDGIRTSFKLVKHYGEGEERRITRPVAGSVRVSVSGNEQVSGWTIGALGVVQFAIPPAAGAPVRAGFLFDTPVRFAEDRLDINRASFLAGEAPSVPLIEIREG